MTIYPKLKNRFFRFDFATLHFAWMWRRRLEGKRNFNSYYHACASSSIYSFF